MVIYNKIVNDKVEFVNEISDLLNNAMEKKEFENLKDDSCICDVKIKGYNKYNKEKNSAVKRKGWLLKEKAVRKIIKKKIVLIAKIIIIIIIIIIVIMLIIIIIMIIIMIMIMIIMIIMII